LFSRTYYLLDAFFKFCSRYHQGMPATLALDAEIGAGSQYFPLFASAWMLFF